MPIIRAPRPDRDFTVIANRVLNDPRLSWAARGMLAHLLSKPDHWSVNVQALINETQACSRASGRDAVYRTLDELNEAGYIARRRLADGSVVTTVYEQPNTENPDEALEPNLEKPHEVTGRTLSGQIEPVPENPDMGHKPNPEKPDLEKPDLENPDVLVRTESIERTEEAVNKTFPHSLRERFDIFWAAYPRKVEKKDAQKAFDKLCPDDMLLEEILTAVEKAKRSSQWSRKQFIPHAATWLNAARWQDEIDTEYTNPQLEVIEAYNASLGDQLGRVNPTVFVETRANAIDDFVTFRPQSPKFWLKYFPWIAAKVDVPPRCGFDWIIGREGFTKVSGGQFTIVEQ
ncbi:hypothetical protein F3J20_16105 [Paraburkholderia sp. Cy-641]|uniref:hypothetical protein n=1 Tax=Paraburkholderia sp. Cy-641 TaxID=2608337 RepID=UPI00141DF838|nr:hypothetical protein [Paraburkholderia sp. Cy-641]NIF78891.1 hypothetical protein [Paraburkholderia sp. Cy-641]